MSMTTRLPRATAKWTRPVSGPTTIRARLISPALVSKGTPAETAKPARKAGSSAGWSPGPPPKITCRPAASAPINSAPALRRAREPRQQGGFAVTLEVYDQRESLPAQAPDQLERVGADRERTLSPVKRAVQREHVVHGDKAPQERRVFF